MLALTNADYYLTKDSLIKKGNYNSTWGQGSNTPSDIIEKNEVKIPNGKLTKSNIPHLCLQHDEFIIYDESQLKLKYIVRVKPL